MEDNEHKQVAKGVYMKNYKILYLGIKTDEFYVKADSAEAAYKKFRNIVGNKPFFKKIEETTEKEYMEFVDDTKIINVSTFAIEL